MPLGKAKTIASRERRACAGLCCSRKEVPCKHLAGWGVGYWLCPADAPGRAECLCSGRCGTGSDGGDSRQWSARGVYGGGVQSGKGKNATEPQAMSNSFRSLSTVLSIPTDEVLFFLCADNNIQVTLEQGNGLSALLVCLYACMMKSCSLVSSPCEATPSSPLQGKDFIANHIDMGRNSRRPRRAIKIKPEPGSLECHGV